MILLLNDKAIDTHRCQLVVPFIVSVKLKCARSTGGTRCCW